MKINRYALLLSSIVLSTTSNAQQKTQQFYTCVQKNCPAGQYRVGDKCVDVPAVPQTNCATGVAICDQNGRALTCNGGYRLDKANGRCVQCDRNTYSAGGTQTSCLWCPSGTCSDKGSSHCVAIPVLYELRTRGTYEERVKKDEYRTLCYNEDNKRGNSDYIFVETGFCMKLVRRQGVCPFDVENAK